MYKGKCLGKIYKIFQASLLKSIYLIPLITNLSPLAPSQFSLLILLKTSENQRFSDAFREIKREHWEEKD